VSLVDEFLDLTIRNRSHVIKLDTTRKCVAGRFEHISAIDKRQYSHSVRILGQTDLNRRRDWLHSRLECSPLVRSA
jgi:hypothetical protein